VITEDTEKYKSRNNDRFQYKSILIYQFQISSSVNSVFSVAVFFGSFAVTLAALEFATHFVIAQCGVFFFAFLEHR
jgi:hypothetical protein